MGAVPDEQSVRPDAPMLGSLLVERGLLSEEQLAAGLAEQSRTGEPLGKVIIELGFVEAGLVAQALATQHGGLLKSEYGFATGFGTGRPLAPVLEPPLSLESSEAAPPAPGSAELRLAPAPSLAPPVALPEPPRPVEGTVPSESAHVEPPSGLLAPVGPASVEPPAADVAVAEEIAEPPGPIVAIEVETETQSVAVPTDQDDLPVELEPAAPVADLEAESTAARVENLELRERLVRERLTDVERRLELVLAEVAALQGKGGEPAAG